MTLLFTESLASRSGRWIPCNTRTGLHRIKSAHIIVRNGKVKDVRISADAVRVGALGNDNIAVLERPADEELRGRLAILARNISELRIIHMSTLAEWRVCDDMDVLLAACIDNGGALEERRDFDLVDRGLVLCAAEFVEMGGAIVRDAN